MEFFDTLRQVKTNWNPYKTWELEQRKKEKQNEKLRQKYPPTQEELKRAEQYGRTIVDVINTMDQHSIDKSEDASLMIQNAIFVTSTIASGIVGFATGMLTVPLRKKNKINLPPSIIGILATTTCMGVFHMVGEIWGAQIEKQASRIARFQTRRDDLKDPRHFVIYNEQQIEEAKKLAASLPEVEEKKKDISLKNSFNPIKAVKTAKKTTDSLKKDYSSYKNWQNNHLKMEAAKLEKFKNITLTPEEKSKAEKDRDNILMTIRKIENSSLNYLMNMKMAISTLVLLVDTAAFTLGFGIIKLVSHLQKTKVIKEKSTFAGVTKMMSLKLAPLFALALISPSIKLMKDAARIGRFKAKQELLSDPQNFIAFDSEQRKSVTIEDEQESRRKGFFTTVKNDIASMKQLKKDYEEYSHYLKTTRKEELKLNKALEEVKITDEQKKEAEMLQKKAFYSFEKMDEKSQRFTDDTDAGVDIANSLIMSPIGIAAKIFTMTYYGKIAKKNKNIELKTIKDMYTILKHFNTKDILKVAGIGLIPSIIHIPLLFKGIQIKKEAGKIGVMTAMQDLDDPKHFTDDPES